MQQQPEFVSAEEALRVLKRFDADRTAQGIAETASDRQKLETVRRDAIQRIIQHRDADTFREMDRLRHIELEYLYQVRGLRQIFPSAVFGEGYAGYGNSWTGTKIQLLYPQDRKRAGRAMRELVLPKSVIDATGDLGEQLVPLRISVETDRYQLRDRLLWNAEDKTIPLEVFVENLLEDYGLPLNLTTQIVTSLQDQLGSFAPHLYDGHPAPAPASKPARRDENEFRSATRTDSRHEFRGESRAETRANSREAREAQTRSPEPNEDTDMRIVIKIDITIGEHTIVDQFEWDINNKHNSPEEFAECLVGELSLPMEFGPAIAHSIREQSQAYTRVLFSSGYQFDGRRVADRQLQSQLSPPVGPTSFLRRPEMLPLYSPALNQISAHAIESQEQERNRETRSRRRMGRSRRFGASSTLSGGASTEISASDDPTLVLPTHDLSTPVYSALLPGGVDRNLDVLRMVAYRSDDSDFSDLVYQFNKLKTQRGIPSASHFTPGLAILQDRFMIKLKAPKSFLEGLPPRPPQPDED